MKVLSLDSLTEACREWRRDGAVIVHCHGCFDPVHLGHILHYKAAKALGNVLVVTVTPDEFVDKGPGRPRFTAQLRAEAIAEIECVDAVAVGDRRFAPVGYVRPHIFAKGAEYRDNLTPNLRTEMFAVEAAGGRLEFISGEAVYSSTALLAGV